MFIRYGIKLNKLLRKVSASKACRENERVKFILKMYAQFIKQIKLQ